MLSFKLKNFLIVLFFFACQKENLNTDKKVKSHTNIWIKNIEENKKDIENFFSAHDDWYKLLNIIGRNREPSGIVAKILNPKNPLKLVFTVSDLSLPQNISQNTIFKIQHIGHPANISAKFTSDLKDEYDRLERIRKDKKTYKYRYVLIPNVVKLYIFDEYGNKYGLYAYEKIDTLGDEKEQKKYWFNLLKDAINGDNDKKQLAESMWLELARAICVANPGKLSIFEDIGLSKDGQSFVFLTLDKYRGWDPEFLRIYTLGRNEENGLFDIVPPWLSLDEMRQGVKICMDNEPYQKEKKAFEPSLEDLEASKNRIE